MNEDTTDSPWNFTKLFNNNSVRCCVGKVNEGVGGSRDTKTDGSCGIRQKTTGGKVAASKSSEPKSKHRKPGKQFFITICLPFRPCLLECARVISNLEFNFNEIITYCVSVEASDRSENYSHHMHAFIEFVKPIYILEICEYLKSVYYNLNVDVRPCRSKSNFFKYISKEDVHLYTNVKTSSLHFNYRCYKWAESINKFDRTHPFVTEHRFCYRYLQRYFNDFVKKSASKFHGLRLYGGGDVYSNWMVDVVEWWNGCVRAVNWGTKRKQLYIFGDTNVGKSTLVEKLIGKQNMKFVFYPGVGKFVWVVLTLSFTKLLFLRSLIIHFIRVLF